MSNLEITKIIKKILLSKPFKFVFYFLNKLDSLSKPSKTILILCLDLFLITISFLLTNFFLFESNAILRSFTLSFSFIPVIIIVSSIFYILTGDYLSISKYIKSSEIYNIASRNFILILVILISGFVLKVNSLNYRGFILFWLISVFINIVSRFSLKEILIYSGYLKSKKINKVAIYGAGAAGAQLASSLELAGSHEILAFFDDSKNLWGRKLMGTKIYDSKDIYKFKNKIDQILFAIPSLSKENSKNILEKIKKNEIPVLKVPSIKDLTTGNLTINALRPIDIEDLLGRVAVEPNQKLLKASIDNLNICITGSGGSIGKQIFREIIKLNPKSLLLIDSNEFSLYSLQQEIEDRLGTNSDLKISVKLADVKDFNLIKFLFNKYQIDVVYHAAAYKHVPLIEKNPLQGIENNILTTFAICKAAEELNLSRVILISTDKAVRPTNVMGASKRFAELILQSFAEKIDQFNSSIVDQSDFKSSKFLIVRFGNVLGSSGSVVPLFKKQIAAGGPITLTDERVIRYFMTLSEAAQLVIQASSLSKGGDVFILDMGSPLKIKDLAEQMIRLSGLKVKTNKQSNGDIEIINIGLRPGEKLYEELLIKGNPLKTPHPLIFRVNEVKVRYEELLEGINQFKKSINDIDQKLALETLSKFVPEWKIEKR